MVDIPVRSRRSYSNDRKLALRRRSPRRDVVPYDDDFDRRFEEMERRLMHFEPFSMFPFCGGSRDSWFRRLHDEMRRNHDEMMRIMGESGMGGASFDDFWNVPSMADYFEKDERGQTRFRAKFNLGLFAPEDIEVRVDDRMLTVKAQHTQRSPNAARGQYFCRSMLLPEGVRAHELKSKLDNGILTVEAPAPGVEVEKLGLVGPSRIPITDSGSHRRRIGRLRVKSTKDTISEYVRENADGSRYLKITLPVDDVYDEKNIRIRCGDGKLSVEGDRDGNHFSRTFDVPKTVEPEKLTAELKDGLLTIAGPVP